MTDDLVKRVAKAIELKMQLKDFGQDVGGGEFLISVVQIDRLEQACKEAASAAIAECGKDRDERLEMACAEAADERHKVDDLTDKLAKLEAKIKDLINVPEPPRRRKKIHDMG